MNIAIIINDKATELALLIYIIINFFKKSKHFPLYYILIRNFD